MLRTLGMTWQRISTLRNIVRIDVLVPRTEVMDVDLQDEDEELCVKDVE